MDTVLDGEAGWRGRDGPLHITRSQQSNPLHHAFMCAARQAGYALTPDYNGQQQEGFGPADMTVHKGRRWSATNAYLRPAFRLGHRIAIMEGWRIVQIGTPREIFHAPSTEYVANFVVQINPLCVLTAKDIMA